MSTSHKIWVWFSLLTIFAGPLAFAAAGQENANADGILVLNDAIVLFASVQKVTNCDSQSPLAAAQIYVSMDAGKTWTKRGPELGGSRFEYAYESGGRLWVAGEHTAEGPGINPFLLVPGEKPFVWLLRTIYPGPSDLEGLAFQKNGALVAWIRHINVHRDNWPGATYIHESSDEGRTWKTVGQLKGLSERPGRKFSKIEKQIVAWQVVDLGDRGFVVQHQEGKSATWQSVSQFAFHPCRR